MSSATEFAMKNPSLLGADHLLGGKKKKSFPLLSLPLSRTHFRPMLLP